MIRRRWRTAIGLWRQHGANALIRIATGKVMRGSVVLHLFGLTDPRPLEAREQARSVEAHVATRPEIERLVEQAHQEADALTSFDLGDRCLVQLCEGRLAGYVWMSTRPIVELLPSVRIHVPEDAVYSYRTWTAPAFRGHALQARRHRAILDAARTEGRTRLLCYVASTNFRSLKGVRKSGCRRIGTVRIRSGRDRVSFTVSMTDPGWSGVRGAPDPDPGPPGG